MELRLKILSGTHAGHEMKIGKDKFLVGRSAECHLRPNSEKISRHHCVFLLEEGRATIRDLGSRNGTLVNGERIVGEVELAVGDRVEFGPLQFEVKLIAGVTTWNMDPSAAVVQAPAAEPVVEARPVVEAARPVVQTPADVRPAQEPVRAKPAPVATRPAPVPQKSASGGPEVGEDLAAWLLDSLGPSEEDTKDFSKTDILLKPQAAKPATPAEAAQAETDALKRLNQKRRR